jgi:hypothetical protein
MKIVTVTTPFRLCDMVTRRDGAGILKGARIPRILMRDLRDMVLAGKVPAHAVIDGGEVIRCCTEPSTVRQDEEEDFLAVEREARTTGKIFNGGFLHEAWQAMPAERRIATQRLAGAVLKSTRPVIDRDGWEKLFAELVGSEGNTNSFLNEARWSYEGNVEYALCGRAYKARRL